MNYSLLIYMSKKQYKLLILIYLNRFINLTIKSYIYIYHTTKQHKHTFIYAFINNNILKYCKL